MTSCLRARVSVKGRRKRGCSGEGLQSLEGCGSQALPCCPSCSQPAGETCLGGGGTAEESLSSSRVGPSETRASSPDRRLQGGQYGEGRVSQAEKQLVQRPRGRRDWLFGDSKEVSVTGSERVEGEWQELSQGGRPGPGPRGLDEHLGFHSK